MIPDINEIMLAISSSLAASIVAKTTIATALGLAAAWLARGSRAAVRHTLLAATFGVILLLPIASFVAPRVHIAIRSRVAMAPPPETISATPSVTVAIAGVPIAPSIPESRFALSALLLGGWIVGVLLFLLPVVIGLWEVRSLRRSSLPWQHGRSVVDTLALDAGIHRRVEILLHKTLPGPMICGILHPSIVVPQDAENWGREDLKRAIVHELEHVRRGDWVAGCLARVACALYWFHPLVWIAWRKLVLEAERSCDDAVLERSEGTAYADQLVKLAKRMSVAPESPLLAMASRADLATRVGAVLDSRQRRGRVGTLSVVLACAGAAAFVIVMSPLMVAAAPQLGAPAILHATGDRPSFEVASIKPWKRIPAPPPDGATGPVKVMKVAPVAAGPPPTDRVHLILPISILITSAYNLPIGSENRILGWPNWTRQDFDQFEIQAKIEGSEYAAMQKMTLAQQHERVALMEQSLLADRFGLKVHFETREMPVYALVIAKNGTKLPPAKNEEPMRITTLGNGQAREMTAVGVTIEQFVLSPLLTGEAGGRPVVDHTGLKGTFDFTLKWTPEQLAASGTNEGGADAPPIFTAVREQLGLQLVPSKAPVEVIVIDHIERPSLN